MTLTFLTLTPNTDLEAEPLSGLLYNSLAKADSARYADSEVEVEKMPAAGTPEASYTCSVRLKKIAKLVESDEISKEMLIKNLNYAVKVLESVYVDETRRLCNEDDDLPEVPPNEVPNEVRDWLASTFTRSQTSLKQSREKPRFRSVANAIRAGIMVERIYRRLSSSSNISVPPNVLILLKAGLDDWCFDIFELNEASDNHAMKFVGYELLHKYDLITKFKINTNVLENFLYKLEEGYSKWANPYHNLVHGADVAQTCHFIMSSSKLVNWLTDLEIFATIVAALVHDYEHTGTTNSFHVNTGSDLALLYNDKGVLENYHVSAVFRLLREEDYNILTGLSREEYKEFRALVIDMVLNTDMSLHFQQIKNMKQLLSMPENFHISACLGDGGFCLPRPWNDIIKENRSQWKARAEIEEAEKAAKCAAEDASGGAAAAVATGGASAAGSRGAHKPPSEEHQQQQQQGASRPPLGTINEDKH
uniref:Phosphodiesterase n=1 Tax=Macrostomum lignano TaxID=282301 RepID=A0A1I8IEA5_9PLAT